MDFKMLLLQIWWSVRRKQRSSMCSIVFSLTFFDYQDFLCFLCYYYFHLYSLSFRSIISEVDICLKESIQSLSFQKHYYSPSLSSCPPEAGVLGLARLPWHLTPAHTPTWFKTFGTFHPGQSHQTTGKAFLGLLGKGRFLSSIETTRRSVLPFLGRWCVLKYHVWNGCSHSATVSGVSGAARGSSLHVQPEREAIEGRNGRPEEPAPGGFARISAEERLTWPLFGHPSHELKYSFYYWSQFVSVFMAPSFLM